MLHDVDAVVLVGGKGTRLRPLTLSAPKPMLPTAGVPFLDPPAVADPGGGHRACRARHLLQRRDVRDQFGDGSSWAWRSSTSSRTSRWAPAAASQRVRAAARTTPCWCSTATCSSGADLRRAAGHPPQHEADVTLHLVRVGDPRAFGCVPTDADGRVHGFPGEDRGPADRPDQRRLLRLPARGDRGDPDGPGGVGGARDVPRAARVRRPGVRARRHQPTGATWARRRTSCAARRTWCAASRRRPHCPGHRASR